MYTKLYFFYGEGYDCQAVDNADASVEIKPYFV